jgi:hypothetical protein
MPSLRVALKVGEALWGAVSCLQPAEATLDLLRIGPDFNALKSGRPRSQLQQCEASHPICPCAG